MAKTPQQSEKKSNRIIGRRYRFAEDYQLIPDLKGNGRNKRIVYIGPWILPTNEPEEYKRVVRWMRILTALVLIAVFAAMEQIPFPATYKWYFPILVISLFPLLHQVMGAWMLPAKICHMERQRYEKSFGRIGSSAMFTFVVLCLSALAYLIYWIIAATSIIEGEAPYALADGIFAALLVFSAVTELQVRRLSRRIKTDTLDNSAYQP